MNWNHLPLRARAYVAAVLLLGGLPLLRAVSVRPAPGDLWLPLAMLLAGIAATQKLSLVGRPGAVRGPVHEMSTMSPAFPVVLGALLVFGTERGILVALASALGASLYPRRHPLHQAAFTAANLGLAALASGSLMRALAPEARVAWGRFPAALPNPEMPLLPILAGTVTYYGVNTVMVAVAVALSQRKSPLAVWHAQYLWTAPGFLAGGAVAGMGLALAARYGTAVASLSLLCLYLVYHSYRIHLERLHSLEESRRALQQARDELEERVRERTTALAQSNESLQREIAERRQAEAARRQLLARLVTVQEEERRRISRELHDQMGQHLTTLMLGLDSLEGRDAGRTSAQVARLRAVVADLIRDVQRLARELRPAALDDLGLPSALQRCAEAWERHSGPALHVHSAGFGAERLPAPVESTLYRVAQEALTNIHRHARARNASILLERREGEVLLIVEDDGTGFEAPALAFSPDARDRLGLLGMRERIALVGGTLEIESAPGCGTTLFARVPI